MEFVDLYGGIAPFRYDPVLCRLQLLRSLELVSLVMAVIISCFSVTFSRGTGL